MEHQHFSGSFPAYNMDFDAVNNMYSTGADYMKPSEGNTQVDFTLYGDEGIDLANIGAFDTSFDNSQMFPISADETFSMPQNLAMDSTLAVGDVTAWNTAPNFDFTGTAAPTPMATPMMRQPSLASYQPLNSNMKRPLQLDTTNEFPVSKRHESAQFGSNFSSPFMTDASLTTGSSWTMDAQQPIVTPLSNTPADLGLEVGLSDEAADMCLTWFSKYNTLPSDRHIESLSQLTGEPANSIRTWFGQMLKQGMAGHDSAYKSQTSLSQSDPGLTNATTLSQTETAVPASNQETTASPTPRGGKKGCTPTNNPALLRRDANKIYQCTRKCGKRYGRKCDWKRNEEEGYPSKSWKCSLCVSQGVEKVKPCFRKYHFSQHFRNIHAGVDSNDYEQTSLVESETDFPRRCGFCTTRFTSRQDRIDHIADHFKAGKCMLDWNDDEDDNSGSDDNDGDDDNNDDSQNGFPGSKDSSEAPDGQPGPSNQQGGDKDNNGNGNGFGGNYGSYGGFIAFQSAVCQQSSTGQSSSQEQGVKQGFEQGTKQHIIEEDIDESQQEVPPRPSPQHVPGGSTRNSETAGDDAHALARNVVAGRLIDATQLSRNKFTSDDLKKLLAYLAPAVSSLLDLSVASDKIDAARQAFAKDILSSLLQPQTVQDGARSRSLLTQSTSGGVQDGMRDFSKLISGDGDQQDGLTMPQSNELHAKGQPDAILDLLVGGGMSKDVLNTLACAATQMILDATRHNTDSLLDKGDGTPTNASDDKLDDASRLWGLPQSQVYYARTTDQLDTPPDRNIPPLLQLASFLQNWTQTQTQTPQLLSTTFSKTGFVLPEQVPDISISSVVEWKEITTKVEVSYLKSQSFLSLKLLGSGGFSTVDEVVHKETNLRISRKTLKNRQQSAMDELKKEVEVLQKLRHPHIVRFLGAYSKGDKVSILLSPVAETTLAVWLEKCHVDRPAGLSDTVTQMFGCLASSIRYLHEQRPVIKHMDIKPQNILVMHGSNDIPHVVLSDFGISSSEENHNSDNTPKPLTRRYCAPETVLGTSRDQAADIWSLGCVFLEMLMAGFGDQDDSQWHVFRKEFSGRKGKYYWQEVPRLHEWLVGFLGQATTSTVAATLRTVKSMLSNDPADRPIASTVAMVFTPASCCLSWPNENAYYPGPTEELENLQGLLEEDQGELLAQPTSGHALCTHDQDPFCRAKAWLSDCAQNHEACQRDANEDGNVLPTRLIDIHPDGASDGTCIRLVNSEGLVCSLQSRPEYTTLSYVWGDVQDGHLKLSKELLPTLQDKMSRSKLPQVFQDAVEATDRLGFRYLWIDSLCILQDSNEDKHREIIAMASTFRNAVLNLAAVKESFPVSGTNNPQLAIPADRKSTVSSWATRRWTYQESFLSPRTLYLTGEQLYWECTSLKASETFPQGLPSLVWEKVHTKTLDTVAPVPTLYGKPVKGFRSIVSAGFESCRRHRNSQGSRKAESDFSRKEIFAAFISKQSGKSVLGDPNNTDTQERGLGTKSTPDTVSESEVVPTSAQKGHRHDRTAQFDFSTVAPSSSDHDDLEKGTEQDMLMGVSHHQSGIHTGKAQTDMSPHGLGIASTMSRSGNESRRNGNEKNANANANANANGNGNDKNGNGNWNGIADVEMVDKN